MGIRRTKVVCTLGPASERVEVLCRLIEAGMDVARFNLSHGSHRDHRVRLEALRAAEAETGKPVAVLFDGKGPEVRLGEFRDGGAALEEGARFILTVADVVGDSRRAPVTHKGLTRDVRPGDVVLLDDGNASLVVLSLGIPVIVGAEKATEILKNGMVVTIDPVRGLVYKGKARVL